MSSHTYRHMPALPAWHGLSEALGRNGVFQSPCTRVITSKVGCCLPHLVPVTPGRPSPGVGICSLLAVVLSSLLQPWPDSASEEKKSASVAVASCSN